MNKDLYYICQDSLEVNPSILIGSFLNGIFETVISHEFSVVFFKAVKYHIINTMQ